VKSDGHPQSIALHAEQSVKSIPKKQPELLQGIIVLWQT
jgi:hypothetical protein